MRVGNSPRISRRTGDNNRYDDNVGDYKSTRNVCVMKPGPQSGAWALLLILGLITVPAHAVKPDEGVLARAEAVLPPSRPVSYTTATNEELDALGARWGYLSAPERRALLAEVRRRMAQNTGNTGGVRIQSTRQFGVVKRLDGTTIRVERRIIRMIPADQGYGTGFEQRADRDSASLPSTPQEAEHRALEQEQLQRAGGADPSGTLPVKRLPAEGMLPPSAPLERGSLRSPESSH